MIWDSQTKRHLLQAQGTDFNGSTMAFSPDGHFFACGTVGSDLYLWKVYMGHCVLHQKFASSITSPTPIFSPDSASVITWGDSTIQLWHLEDSAPPTSRGIPQASGQVDPFILKFSPSNGSAAFARPRDNVVTVIESKSGARRLVIDAGMEVYGLNVDDATVTVEGNQKIMVWGLPEECSEPVHTATVADSVRLTALKTMHRGPNYTSISPNLRMIAETWPPNNGSTGWLVISDVETGSELCVVEGACSAPWFSADGRQIWCEVDGGGERGWRIAESSNGGSREINLVPLAESPPESWPLRSSRGCTIADDGRVLGPGGEELVLLPPSWMSNERKTRAWSGPFLVLLHSTLPEPVILDLE